MEQVEARSSQEGNRLVLVVPLREGRYERALELLAVGPPFDPDSAALVRHDVYVTPREVVFVFESPPGTPIALRGEDSSLWRAANEWRKVMAGPARKARTAFSWQRDANRPDRV